MIKKANNQSLGNARDAKQDEFYTQLGDISNELKHYKAQLRGKTIFCNCDDPFESNFFKYFALNFNALGLQKLIATSYKGSPIAGSELSLFPAEEAGEVRESYAIEINEIPDQDGNGAIDLTDVEYLLKHDANTSRRLYGDSIYGAADFRSRECVELLKQSDIVITNPPFSLFREFVSQLVEHDKKFLIIGSKNAITFRDVFPFIRENKLWLGHGFAAGNAYFKIPAENVRAFASGVYEESTGLVKFRNVGWFTNLDYENRHEKLPLYKKYTPDEYPKYDNYDAIEVSKVAEIPIDYFGTMGVPITFLDKYNPEQFEILAVTQSWCDGRIKTYPRQIQVGADGVRSEVTKLNDGAALKLGSPPNGTTYYIVDSVYYTKVYARILIRRKTS